MHVYRSCRTSLVRTLRHVVFVGLCAALAVPSSAISDEVRDYGEYLAGECTTCHRIDGKDKGIPPIIGWDVRSFITVLNSFKSGERDNKAMVSVAKTLDDDQIRALATYFGSLKPKED